jgi:hypothetical protein
MTRLRAPPGHLWGIRFRPDAPHISPQAAGSELVVYGDGAYVLGVVA